MEPKSLSTILLLQPITHLIQPPLHRTLPHYTPRLPSNPCSHRLFSPIPYPHQATYRSLVLSNLHALNYADLSTFVDILSDSNPFDPFLSAGVDVNVDVDVLHSYSHSHLI